MPKLKKIRGWPLFDHPHCSIHLPVPFYSDVLNVSPSHLKYCHIPMSFYPLATKESLTAYKISGTAAANMMHRTHRAFSAR